MQMFCVLPFFKALESLFFPPKGENRFQYKKDRPVDGRSYKRFGINM